MEIVETGISGREEDLDVYCGPSTHRHHPGGLSEPRWSETSLQYMESRSMRCRRFTLVLPGTTVPFLVPYKS